MSTSASGVTAAPSFVNGVRESTQAASAWLGRNTKWLGEKGSNLVSAIAQLAKSLFSYLGDLLGKIKQAGSEGISTSSKFIRENSREMRFAAIGALVMGILVGVHRMCKRKPTSQEPAPPKVEILPAKNAKSGVKADTTQPKK